jgi:hypothetical protein
VSLSVAMAFYIFFWHVHCLGILNNGSNLELASGLDLTSLLVSFPILVNALAIADQRFIFLPFLNSNALPISISYFGL